VNCQTKLSTSSLGKALHFHSDFATHPQFSPCSYYLEYLTQCCFGTNLNAILGVGVVITIKITKIETAVVEVTRISTSTEN
jgi:hypothetical protein